MTSHAIRVTRDYFQGAGKVHDKDEGLAAVVRGLAIDHARIKLTTETADLTDSSTGTPSKTGVLVAQAKSVAAFTEAGTASAQKAATDTAIGKVNNAHAVLAEYMNRLSGRLGLDKLVNSTGGTIATAGTIAALDLSVTGVSSSCVDIVTLNDRLAKLGANAAALGLQANRILAAVGYRKMTGTIFQSGKGIAMTLEAVAATGSSNNGTALQTAAAATVTAQLAIMANNIATIAYWLTEATGAAPADLTDSTGGSASATRTLVANATPAAAAGAATTSAPKAGFDTVIGVIEANLSDLALRTNLLLRRNGLDNDVALLTDNTGVTSDTTLAAITNNLTAVDGSSGTSAVDVTTAAARMATINNGISSIAAKVNVLCDFYGERTITDSLGGTVSDAIENVAATGTGVGGATPVTMLDSAVDTWLGNCRDQIATIAAVLATMTNSTNDVPLHVVAFD